MTSTSKRINKVRIGDCIELVKIKCGIPNLTVNDVSGINRDKEFFEPAKQVGNDTSDYKVVPPNCFACNLMHIGRDVVLPISINTTDKNKIVSGAYHVFKFVDESKLLKEYFFIFLNSSEKDRYFWFHCDSSVRDGMDWDVFCDVEIEVPSIEIQKKYVAIYESLLSNLHSYQSNVDDLKLVCDSFIEKLRKSYRTKLIGHLHESNERNVGNVAKTEKGVSIQKVFIDTKAKSSDVEKQKLVKTGYFAFNSNTSRNSDTISIALNNDEPCAVSNTYIVFKCDDSLVPDYLYLWFKRKEFDRFARFHSWGSARETIALKDIEQYEIAIPSIEIQNSIVNLLKIYDARLSYQEELKNIICNICPILIRGSLLEAKGGDSNAN